MRRSLRSVPNAGALAEIGYAALAGEDCVRDLEALRK